VGRWLKDGGSQKTCPTKARILARRRVLLGMKSGDPWVFGPGIFLWRGHALLLEDKGRTQVFRRGADLSEPWDQAIV